MNVLHFITMLAVGLTGIALTSCNGDERVAERHELSAVLESGVWKIVDAENPKEKKIEVARGDTVVWQAPDESDIYFQFMDKNLTGVFTAVVNSGESLSLVIGKDAKVGDNPYAVFVLNGRSYARGESPPRMMIRE